MYNKTLHYQSLEITFADIERDGEEALPSKVEAHMKMHKLLIPTGTEMNAR
jgi:hypothetical protein